MLALRTSPPSFGPAEAERLARDLYGLAVSVSALPGERDTNFRLRTAGGPRADAREFVLKIQGDAADAQSIDSLTCVLDHLAEQDPGLPVPRLFPTQRGEALGRFSRDGIDYATCLVSFLPGRLLADSPPSAALLQNMGATLARVDRALQGFFHPSLNRRLAWDVRRLPELAEFSAAIEPEPVRAAVDRVCSAFRDCLPRLRGLRSQAIHGDCHAANLLVDVDGHSISGILDFGDMIHAPLIFEPAVAMSELLTEDVARLDSLGNVLHGYTQGRSLQADEVESLYDIVAARHAVTLLVHAWRMRHDHHGARVLEEAAVHAGRSLDRLMKADRQALTRAWHEAADTAGLTASTAADGAAPGAAPHSVSGVDLGRRRRLMGAGAELFYEEPLHLVRGAGVWLYDAQERAYLDVYNNVPHVGHAHPTVVAAIQNQTAILATHTRYLHESILEYAERLTARLPAHLNACIFVNSGSEANDVAWRMARMATGHQGALVMQHAYHGITDAAAALTRGVSPPHDPRVETLAPPPVTLRAGDAMGALDQVEAVRDADRAIARLAARGAAPAAFFIDSAITSSGIFDPPAAWAAAVTGCVKAAGGLVIADEVQYGLGRSGSHFWGFGRRGLEPDIVTLGKPVGNGYPMGVVVADRALIEAFQARFGFFSTFGGNAVAAAAGLAVLKVLDGEALMANALATGDYLRGQLESVAVRHEFLGQVRGSGLLLGLESIGRDAAAAKWRNLRMVNVLASEFRILTGYEGPQASILKLRPPMPFRREHADLLVQAIDAAAASIERDRE
ncbi:MAG TPA: aminotransferase class III-fold pyridoxal phosphate-dependent enzyme [Steroidobacteraceae bacterium]|nr:aminotransferase class III-fold pyridoxal phosphate-dependent enzyme [Steroidobacteraceae bacterium]